MIKLVRNWLRGVSQAPALPQRLAPSTLAETAAPSHAPSTPRVDSRSSSRVMHVCVVSGEAMANVIPILHDSDVTDVLLLHTDTMAANADKLRRYLETDHARGWRLNVIQQRLDDASSAELRQSMTALRQRLDVEAPGVQLRINVTGGTVPMKLALADALHGRALAQRLYTDTSRMRIQNLSNDRETRYEDLLDIQRYLAIQGHKEGKSLGLHPAWKQRCEEVSPQVEAILEVARLSTSDELRTFLKVLNATAQEAMTSFNINSVLQRYASTNTFNGMHALLLGSWDETHGELRAWHDATFPMALTHASGKGNAQVTSPNLSLGPASAPVLKRLVSSGLLIEHPNDTTRFAFPDYRTLAFLGGGWLEWHAARVAADAGVAAPKFRHGMEVATLDGTWNEIDLCVVDHNRMLLVEAKTSQSHRGMGSGKTKLADAMYKLDSLRGRIGSGLSTALILSAVPLSDAEEKRIRSFRNMYFCAGPDVLRFDEFLRCWRENRMQDWKPAETAVARVQKNVRGANTTRPKATAPVREVAP